MKKAPSLAALMLASVVGAWSADVIVDGAPLHFGAGAAAGSDATLELKWDNGTRLAFFATGTGAGYWVGNDWDLSAIPRYRAITKIKVYSCGDWPNRRWDGVRAGIFAFDRVPGSMIWPTAGGPYFFVPTGMNGWKEIPVAWVLPEGVRSFVAAAEQYYDYPNCDPFLIDNNTTFRGHSWHYKAGKWEPFYHVPIAPYRNLMLRVVVGNESVGVAPESLGRVKALYY